MRPQPQFGTHPHKLHRRDGPETSVEAAHAVDTTTLEQLVYDEIKRNVFGCIQDDLLTRFSEYPYSSITARFSALVRKGLVRRTGEKRQGRSGRNQAVMIAVTRKEWAA